LENFVKEVVAEPEEDEAKTRFRKNMIRAKRIIADSIKYHLIPHVSTLDTLKKINPSFMRIIINKSKIVYIPIE
jgi:hypothetical protein